MSDSAILGCLCGCGRMVRVRGLSLNCYNALQSRVKAGELTWAEAESRGLCARPKTRAQRRDRFFMTSRGSQG